MCGRYSTPPEQFFVEQGFELAYAYTRVFNAAPTLLLPIALNTEPSVVIPGRWGFVPFYMRTPKPSDGIINARAESLVEGKKAFAREFRDNRCLVFASGFFEWQKVQGGPKQPFHIGPASRRPFAFAGIWRQSRELEQTTYAIVTTNANKTLSSIHDRMPVILRPDDERLWLEGERLEELLEPYPDDDTEAFRVSTLVNSARNNVPEVLKPLEA